MAIVNFWWSKLTLQRKYGGILTLALVLTLGALTSRRVLPPWFGLVTLGFSSYICLRGMPIAKLLGDEMERDREVKQFAKVVRVKQLEAQSKAEIREYESLLGLSPPPNYDPNLHEIATPSAITSKSSPPDSSQAILEQVEKTCGEKAIALIIYCSNKGLQYSDRGWFSVDLLRSNWGRNNSLNKQQLLNLLTAINQVGGGKFSDSTQTYWQPYLLLEES